MACCLMPPRYYPNVDLMLKGLCATNLRSVSQEVLKNQFESGFEKYTYFHIFQGQMR